MHYEGNVLVVDPGEVISDPYPYQPMWGGWGGYKGYGYGIGPGSQGWRGGYRGRRGPGRWRGPDWRGGTFAGMGNECSGCGTPIDPRAAPVWSNTYRLASAAALNRVPTARALGAVNLSSTGVYLLALAVPAVVIASLFFMGVIKVD